MEMKKILCAAALACAFAGNTGAAELPFAGTVTATCTLIVGLPGTLAPNTASTVLGTRESGGNAGTVTALATGAGFSVSVQAPSSFNARPAGGESDVVFTSDYSSSGATNIAITDAGVTAPLNVGTTELSVEMAATKSTGSFPAGAYLSAVTITCE